MCNQMFCLFKSPVTNTKCACISNYLHVISVACLLVIDLTHIKYDNCRKYKTRMLIVFNMFIE